MPWAPQGLLEHAVFAVKVEVIYKHSSDNTYTLESSGRYDQIPRENRLCLSCRSSEIEDEIHFLFNCLKYSIPRDEFYSKVLFCAHNVKQLPPIEAIKELINFSYYFVNLQLMKFVLSCSDLRRKLLSI